MELMDNRQLNTPGDCTSMEEECDKKSIVQDHKDNHKVGGQNCLAVTEEQFCAMFYHVKERKREKISFKCLEESKCKIGNLKRLHSNPRARARTVVVYVRLTDRMGKFKFHARYGNCFQGKRNIFHAEHFMLKDEDFRQHVKLLRDQKGGKIEMYMNKQPCFRSTGVETTECAQEGVKRKQCAQDLVNFYKLFCLFHGIKLTVNLCELSRVDMLPSPSLENDIQNALLGMQMMMSAGIELKAMTEESWRKLAGYANNIILPEYIDGDRQKLDQRIEKFLQRIKPTYFFRQFSSRNHSKGVV